MPHGSRSSRLSPHGAACSSRTPRGANVILRHCRLSLRLDKTETSFRAVACFAAALMKLLLADGQSA